MDIERRLSAFRRKMKEEGVDFYIVPTADFHGSEYTGDYFRVREWLSGFTGSNGDLLIGPDFSGLFTDGRYFIQAQRELQGSGIRLFRMQEPGVPELTEYLCEKVLECNREYGDGEGKKVRVGFDGRTLTADFTERLAGELERAGADYEFCWDRDLARGLWEDRPPLPCAPVRVLPENLTGESCGEKLHKVREAMASAGASAHLLAKLDDIMWLLNIRGDDVACNPVALCYLYLTEEGGTLFIDGEKLCRSARDYLRENGIETAGYTDIYEFLKTAGRGEGADAEGCVDAVGCEGGVNARSEAGGCKARRKPTLLLDKRSVNHALYRCALLGFRIVQAQNPTLLRKAVKNPTELENLRRVHLRDGAAFTKFMFRLKNRGPQGLTELSAAGILESFRREQEGYLGPSFQTISAYGKNAALMHYAAGPETDAALEEGGLYLVDSGGQYEGGTTDITRTVAIGEVPPEQKRHFTAVLKGMLHLSSARFLYGCTGRNLDILAREPLWQMSLDYKCGTGHGVGYMLNVHEGPQSFRWRPSGDAGEAVLTEGMVITDEPGVYVEGSHGVRLENELICRFGEENENGRFLCFETLTFAPIDLDAVAPELLGEEDRERLNAYHALVRKKLRDLLGEEERQWLEQSTRPIENIGTRQTTEIVGKG